MCADDIPVFDDSHKMMELYRRERVAYEQMRRHSDAPDGRLHQLWMSKLYKVQQEIRDELYEKTNDEQTFRLSFDISAEADPSDLLDRLIEFQQQLVDELEEGEDVFGEPVPNHATADTCSVEYITIKGGER